MTNTKLSDLTAWGGGTAPAGSIPIAHSGVTYRVTPAQIVAGVSGGGGDLTVTGGGTVTDVTSIAFSGATVSGSSGAATVTVSGGGGLLAITNYNPATTEDITVGVSGSFAALDATNLSVTFTVPASGNVIVVLSAAAYADGTVTSREQFWGLINASGGAYVANSARSVLYTENDGIQARPCARIYITGLTPGASITYRWAGRSNGGNTSIYAGNSSGDEQGAATMEVWTA